MIFPPCCDFTVDQDFQCDLLYYAIIRHMYDVDYQIRVTRGIIIWQSKLLNQLLEQDYFQLYRYILDKRRWLNTRAVFVTKQKNSKHYLDFGDTISFKLKRVGLVGVGDLSIFKPHRMYQETLWLIIAHWMLWLIDLFLFIFN